MGWEVAEKVRSVYGDVQYTDQRGSCAPGYIQDGALAISTDLVRGWIQI